MKRFAIDVVILPPESVMDMAIEQNRLLQKSRPDNIMLSKTHYLPHISIVMGCLSEDKLDDADIVLQAIAARRSAMELQVPCIKTVSGNKTTVTYDIKLSHELITFHELVVSSFKPLLTQDASNEALADAPPIESSSINWINHFIPQHCFDHFWPHITLGFGEPLKPFQPFSFKASRLAICHLGNHCTCKNILREAILAA
jgi:hypothetical protein